MPSASARSFCTSGLPSSPSSEPMRPSLRPIRLPSPSYSTVAVSQLPTSEIEASVLPSGETCRSDQLPKFGELAVIEMPPRHRSLPSRLRSGWSSLSGTDCEWMSSATGWAPTGVVGGPPVQAAISRQTKRKERRAGRMPRPCIMSSSSGPRASCALMSLSELEARGPYDLRGALAAAALGRLADGARGALAVAGGAGVLLVFLVEQRGELFHHRAAELVGIDDGDGAAIVARDVVADANGNQLDRRARLDPVDHVAQMPLEIISRVDR